MPPASEAERLARQRLAEAEATVTRAEGVYARAVHAGDGAVSAKAFRSLAKALTRRVRARRVLEKVLQSS